MLTDSQAVPDMSFFKEKPEEEDDGTQLPNYSFRPTRRQHAYVHALEKRGYERAEVLRRMVSEYIELEAGLADVVDDIDAFAVTEGIVLPAERRDPKDTLWLPRAIARLALRGLESQPRDGAKKPPKK